MFRVIHGFYTFCLRGQGYFAFFLVAAFCVSLPSSLRAQIPLSVPVAIALFTLVGAFLSIIPRYTPHSLRTPASWHFCFWAAAMVSFWSFAGAMTAHAVTVGHGFVSPLAEHLAFILYLPFVALNWLGALSGVLTWLTNPGQENVNPDGTIPATAFTADPEGRSDPRRLRLSRASLARSSR